MAGASTKAVREHWNAVANIGCLLTGSPATLHHCHGGSMVAVLGYAWSPGMAQKQNDWWVIPIRRDLHVGSAVAIDGSLGVKGWEEMWGSQVEHLLSVCEWLGYDVFERGGFAGGIVEVRRRVECCT